MIMYLRDRLQEAILRGRRNLSLGAEPRLRDRDRQPEAILAIKEQRGMAEIIVILAMVGFVVTVAIAVAYLVIYLFGNNGMH
ncbi:MAG: hypothetical protein U0236_03390 [Nitrospira sp.]